MFPNSTLQNTQHFHPLKQLLKTIAGILLSGMVVSQSPAQMPRENVGDVWVLGRQSNMEFRLSRIENGQLEIVSANLPKIRILTFPFRMVRKTKRVSRGGTTVETWTPDSKLRQINTQPGSYWIR